MRVTAEAKNNDGLPGLLRAEIEDDVYEEGLEAMWVEEACSGTDCADPPVEAPLVPRSPVAPSSVQKSRIREKATGTSRKFLTRIRLFGVDSNKKTCEVSEDARSTPENTNDVNQEITPKKITDLTHETNSKDVDEEPRPTTPIIKTMPVRSLRVQTFSTKEEGEERDLSTLGFDNTFDEASPGAFSLSSLNEILDAPLSPMENETKLSSMDPMENETELAKDETLSPATGPVPNSSPTATSVSPSRRKWIPLSPISFSSSRKTATSFSPSRGKAIIARLSMGRSRSSPAEKRKDDRPELQQASLSFDQGHISGEVESLSESDATGPLPKDHSSHHEANRVVATILEKQTDVKVVPPEVDDSKTLEIDDKTRKLLNGAMNEGDVEVVTSMHGIKRFLSLRQPQALVEKRSTPPLIINPKPTEFLTVPKNGHPALLMQKSWDTLVEHDMADMRDIPSIVRERSKKAIQGARFKTTEPANHYDFKEAYETGDSESSHSSDDSEDGSEISDKYSVRKTVSNDKYSIGTDKRSAPEDKYTVDMLDEDGGDDDIPVPESKENAENTSPNKRGLFGSFRLGKQQGSTPTKSMEEPEQDVDEELKKTPLKGNIFSKLATQAKGKAEGIKLKRFSLFGNKRSEANASLLDPPSNLESDKTEREVDSDADGGVEHVGFDAVSSKGMDPVPTQSTYESEDDEQDPMIEQIRLQGRRRQDPAPTVISSGPGHPRGVDP